MNAEQNWITEAAEHFKKYAGKTYNAGDEPSKKSKEINENLKDILFEKFDVDPEMILSIQGSKWNVQGQNKLSDGIWYRASYKKFGKKYPVVFGVYIGQNGLNFAIQIHNDALENNSKLSKKLGLIISNVLGDKGLERQERLNPSEEYSDYGFFNLLEFSEDKFDSVLKAYKESVYLINKKLYEAVETNFSKLFFNTNKELKSVTHVNISVDDASFYKNKENIYVNFKKFIETPTFGNLEWWDKSINSANMQGNRTNLIKKFESKVIEEVKALKSEAELLKIKEVFENINGLIFDSAGTIKPNLTCKSLNEGIEAIQGMNATARELAYYLQLKEDKIPLLNATSEDCIKHIGILTNFFTKVDDVQARIDFVKGRLSSIFKEEKAKVLPHYFIVDQFFNLLHKVSVKELDAKSKSDLYQYAYLFANLLGKADVKAVDKNGFVDVLKKGKNIIYYGAPGTGKTFGVKNNILSIVQDEDKQFVMTQFHPSYTYEDFIEGIKPTGVQNGVMSLALKDGEFKIFCEQAQLDEDSFNCLQKSDFETALSEFGYFFFVDEINRAELSRVFGELLYCLEYRGADGKIKTQYSSLREDNPYFYIPENLFFIGTMNDIDKSIDSFDLALRRRFVWIRQDCVYEVITSKLGESLSSEEVERYKKACERLNQKISEITGLGDKYQLGHAYFLKIQNYCKKTITQMNLNELFEYHLDPLLREYLRSEYDESGIKSNISHLKNVFKLDAK